MKEYETRQHHIHRTKSEHYFVNFKDFAKVFGGRNGNEGIQSQAVEGAGGVVSNPGRGDLQGGEVDPAYFT